MNKKIISYVIIVLAFALLLLGFIFLIKGEKKESSNDYTVDYTEIAKSLVNYIPNKNNSMYYLFETRVGIESLPKNLLIENGIYNLRKEDFNGSLDLSIPKENCESEGGLFANEGCYVYDYYQSGLYFFNKSVLVERVKEMYQIDIESESIPAVIQNENYSCQLVDDKYYCDGNHLFLKKGDSVSLVEFDKYETSDNGLYVYVKHLYAVYENDDSSGNMIVKVYDKKGGNLLGDAHTIDSNMIFTSYEDKASIYKNTYVKNNENYYWSMIEPA